MNKKLIIFGIIFLGLTQNIVSSELKKAEEFFKVAKVNGWYASDAFGELNVHQLNFRDPITWHTALMFAVKHGNLERVEKLLKRGVDVNLVTWRNRKTALHYAVLSKLNAEEILNLLFQYAVNIDAVDVLRQTPLIIASSECNNAKVVKLLINKGADVNLQDKNGNTAIMRVSRFDIAKELLASNKVNIDMRNYFGNTALMIAAKNGRIDVVKLLLQLNANKDIQNLYGQTALVLAVQSSNCTPAMVKLLLKAGADKDIRDNNGRSAYDHARSVDIAGIIEPESLSGKLRSIVSRL